MEQAERRSRKVSAESWLMRGLLAVATILLGMSLLEIRSGAAQGAADKPRIDALEVKTKSIDDKIDSVDRKVDGVERKMDRMEWKLNQVMINMGIPTKDVK